MEIAERLRMWSRMNSGPVAQLIPTESRGACITEAYSASTPWPASMVPIGSIVTETITGVRQPISAKACSIPISPALRLRVSCVVSRSRTSAPPWSRPRAWIR